MGSFMTLNIRFPSFFPVIAVITYVQVDHDESSQKKMPQSAASGRSDEGDVTYSEVLKKAVGDDNGLSVASKASNDRAPPTYSKESNPKPRRSPQSTSQKGKKQHAGRYENGTALQQHSAYFDPDDDGIIWPWDTYNGCRKFGWGRGTSASDEGLNSEANRH
jgi:hypothetical protein